MSIATETVAEIMLGGEVSFLGANDAARSSFTAWAGDSLIALDPTLNVLGQWPADPQHRGHHATYPGGGACADLGADEVRLLDHAGQTHWRHAHPPWGTKIITTPHMGWHSPLMVRSFPSLKLSGPSILHQESPGTRQRSSLET